MNFRSFGMIGILALGLVVVAIVAGVAVVIANMGSKDSEES